MSVLDRIIPWRRSAVQRTWLAGETHAARDALAANLAGLAQAMEDRFVSLSERIDRDREARAAERTAEQAGLAAALGDVQSRLEARLDALAAAVESGRKGQDFALALRDLKRDLAAQISLGAYDAATEMQALRSALQNALDGRAPSGSGTVPTAAPGSFADLAAAPPSN